MAEYEIVIGLEVHAQLLTESKAFCSCSTEFGAEPNSHTCPGCLGLPGALPVLNKKAVEYAVKAGLAMNCSISRFSIFHRKNYFYPDLAKAYQISQDDLPFCRDGYVEFQLDGQKRSVGINRIHLEEDAGKLVHAGSIAEASSSFADYNRAGVPLIEIVSEPDMRSPEEARAYLNELKKILEYLKVSDCNMEEGSLRCDANISVRPVGCEELGTKTEIKNLNSFRAVQRALEYEAKRQVQVLEDGGKIVQETRHWDEAKGTTITMRIKEKADDYRYFPDPDLPPVVISDEWIQDIAESLPELPGHKRARFMDEYGLPEQDVEVLTESIAMADFFEACVKAYNKPKIISNWLTVEFLAHLNAAGITLAESKVTPENLAGMLKLIDNGTISGKIAKTVFEEIFQTGKSAEAIVKEKGLVQIADEDALGQIIDKVIEENPGAVSDFKAGKGKAIGFLVGQVMRHTKGRANPQMVNEMLKKKLESI